MFSHFSDYCFLALKMNWKPGGHTRRQTNNFLKFGCYILCVCGGGDIFVLSAHSLVSSYLVLCDVVVVVPTNKQSKKENKKLRKDGSKKRKETNQKAKKKERKKQKKE